MENTASELSQNQDTNMTDSEADSWRTRVRQLSMDVNKNTFEIGEALWKLKDQTDHLLRWGCKSIAQLAEMEEIGARKGEYLVRNYDWFKVKHPLPEALDARLLKLPWTKVRELVGIMTSENAIKWLAIAESVSRDELTRKTKAEKESPSTASTSDDAQTQQAAAEIFVRRAFALADTPDHDSDTQASVVGAALKRAAQLSGSEKEGHNLTLICLDFLATNDFRTSTGEAKLQYLTKIETLLGLGLIVVNPDGTQVIFGGETLNRLLDYLAHAEPDVAAVTGMVGEQQ
jgi:hypothetical protein